MKKLLLLGLVSLTNLVYGQDYMSYTTNTTVVTTSNMVWNFNRESWDFIPNNDYEQYNAKWEFVLNPTEQTGTIRCNSIVYSVYGIKPSLPIDGKTTIVINAYVPTTKIHISIILTTLSNGSIFIAIFDEQIRKSYYFN